MKKVLFVDDEQPVLDSVKRMLKPQSNIWDMYFCTSGEAALALLEQQRIDVLVSDMKMPGMTGDVLLQFVHRNYPDIIRIILSGVDEGELDMRKVPIAHHYVEKPCSASLLLNVIDRAYILYEKLRAQNLTSFFEGNAALLEVPLIYVVLTNALSNPKTSADDLVRIIEKDELLSGHLLDFAGSTIIGAKSRPRSLNEAIVAVGLSMIKNAALSFAVFELQEKTIGLSDIYQHALKVTNVAQRIRPQLQQKNDLMLAAMLHDVGKWVIAVAEPERYQKIVSLMEEEGLSFHAAEKSLFEISHAELGASLLEHWGLTYPVVEAVAYHHTPMALSKETLSIPTVLYIADNLVHKRDFNHETLEKLDIAEHISKWQQFVD